MVDLDGLDKTSISEMSYDELVNLLMEIRKSRRTPSSRATRKAKPKTINIDVDSLDENTAMELLKKLEEMKK